MKDSKFWRVIGIGTVFGLLWIGYGLGKNSPISSLSFPSAAYAGDNSTVLEKNAKDKTKPYTLQFTGPFDYSQILLTEEIPVHIDYICFTEKGNGNYLMLGFTFNGKKDPRRVIILTVTAKDSRGKIIAEDKMRCHDARIPEPKSEMGLETCLANRVNADMGKIKPDQIAQLEVKFMQAD